MVGIDRKKSAHYNKIEYYNLAASPHSWKDVLTIEDRI